MSEKDITITIQLLPKSEEETPPCPYELTPTDVANNRHCSASAGVHARLIDNGKHPFHCAFCGSVYTQEARKKACERRCGGSVPWSNRNDL